MEEWDKIDSTPIIEAAQKVCEVCKGSSMEEVYLALISAVSGCFIVWIFFR